MPYTVIAHTADTGIEATAASFPELLSELARGMFELMGSFPAGAPEHVVSFDVASTSLPELVVDALADLLYQSEVEDLFFGRFEVHAIGPTAVRITAAGIGNSAVELTGPPIKAVTYHALTVAETDSGWFGRVYFDV